MLKVIIETLNEINELNIGFTVSLSKYDFKTQNATLIIIYESSDNIEITTIVIGAKSKRDIICDIVTMSAIKLLK